MAQQVPAQHLAPVKRPIGIFDQFIARQTETLILKEKVMSLSGDSFDIKLASGQPVFKIQGRHMTISGRKSLSDMQGNHLFDVVKELMHIHATFAVEDAKGNKIVSIKNSFKRASPITPPPIYVLVHMVALTDLCVQSSAARPTSSSRPRTVRSTRSS